jgi:hypothetical protein
VYSAVTYIYIYVLLSGKASFCIHGVISSPAVNPLGPTEIDCVIYPYDAVSQMNWQVLVLGTGEGLRKIVENCQRSQSPGGALELLLMISMMPYAVVISFLVHAVLIAGNGVQCQDNLNKWLCIAVVTGVPTCIFFRQK